MAVGVWSTTGNMLSQTWQLGGCGSQTAALTVGGNTATGASFNGTSWSSISKPAENNLGNRMCGTISAALSIGTSQTPSSAATLTNLYDDSSWTVGSNSTHAACNMALFGTQSAALECAGWYWGYQDPCSYFDGTSWAIEANYPIAAGSFDGCGTHAAGLGVGGKVSTEVRQATCHEFDGTSWKTGGSLSADIGDHGAIGTQIQALSISGANDDGPVVNTEEYQGDVWRAGGDINTFRRLFGCAGTLEDGLAWCGAAAEAPYLNSTEKYTQDTPPEPTVFHEAEVNDNINALESITVQKIIYGSVCYGHVTDVEEDNSELFSEQLSGTGSMAGTGDNEKLTLSTGQEMVSETIELGEGDCQIQQNKYGSGGEGTLYYRTAATRTACDAAGWTEYTGTFTSLGFVGFKVAK